MGKEMERDLEVHRVGVEKIRSMYPELFLAPPNVNSDHLHASSGLFIKQKTEVYQPKNVFVETISKDYLNLPGGPWEAFAQGNGLEMHYFLYHKTACWFTLNQETLDILAKQLPIIGRRTVVRNKEWNTIGYVVPMNGLVRILGDRFGCWTTLD